MQAIFLSNSKIKVKKYLYNSKFCFLTNPKGKNHLKTLNNVLKRISFYSLYIYHKSSNEMNTKKKFNLIKI